MTMFNPHHPGSILKEDVLPELGIGVTEAAIQLGVSRVINGAGQQSVQIWQSDLKPG
ncbi:MAG: helix-turn-helix transcriptional regulator [Methylococcaceae bacterium]